jgi:hypothetical protein
MAVTEQKSTQLARTAAAPGDGSQSSAGIQVAPFNFTQSGAGDAGSTALLCELSGGRIKIIPELCKAIVSAWGTSRTVAIGYGANRSRPDGTVLAASTAALLTASTTAAAGGTIAGSSFNELEVEVLDRLEIVATVAGGTIPDGATIAGRIAYLPMT